MSHTNSPSKALLFYLQGDEDEEDVFDFTPPPFSITSSTTTSHVSTHPTLEVPKPRTSGAAKPAINKFLSLETSTPNTTNTHNSHLIAGEWPVRSLSTSSALSLATSSVSQHDILKFPVESSHAYSYAHLSPNSLALRLNVLKRSLEILKDRPDLFKLIKEEPEDALLAVSAQSLASGAAGAGSAPRSPLFHPHEFPAPSLRLLYKNPLANNSAESYAVHPATSKLKSNASSAALAALFSRPSLQRAGSLPASPLIQQQNQLHQPKTEQRQQASLASQDYESVSTNVTQESSDLGKPLLKASDVILSDDLKDIISILQQDNSFLEENSDVAQNLHQISLATVDQSKLKQDIVINKLMYALATPFIETSVMTPALLSQDVSSSSQLISPASALNLFAVAGTQAGGTTTPQGYSASSNHTSSRPFHSMTLGKHALPQSVFTVDFESPWSVKAANDLACLMFGILKNMIKSLTFMDLIAPQFRTFVSDKLSLASLNESTAGGAGAGVGGIIFAGEIVAILRPGDGAFAWTSLWAKRRGNMIFCMFDQIPCDAFDMVILSNIGDSNYKIDSVKEVAGKLISHLNQTVVNGPISAISETLGALLKSKENAKGSSKDDAEEEEDEDEDDEYKDSRDSEKINDTRYFTLQLKGPRSNSSIENVPCAMTSNPLEIDDSKHEIKVKIHTLPYIAGIFVVNAQSYRILSCNNAIAKNLFGRSSYELNNQTIDTIIPDFSATLQLGIDHISDSFGVVPGLVLPDHFFRRYSGLLQLQRNNIKNNNDLLEEELFFHSKGLRGVHRDGKNIWVDVQLRASTTDTFVLWITYSRLAGRVGNMSEEIDKLSNSASSLSLFSNGDRKSRSTGDTTELADINDKALKSIERLVDIRNDKPSSLGAPVPATRIISQEMGDREAGTLPSQMELFKNHEDVFEFSSSEVSRKSSTRRVGGGESPSSLNSLSLMRRALSTSIQQPAEDEDPKVSIPKVSVRSDEEIIALENDMIAEKIRKLTEWPSSVGAKRRTKKFSEFHVLKDMGEGAYGKVVLVEHKEDPEYKIIIKCIDKERILVDTWVRDRKLGTIPSEINIMAFLNSDPHPNIMRIIDFFEDLKYYYLETPLFGDPPAIDLFDFIEIKKNMTELECKFIFKQVSLALYHLHKHGIVHRDIKDENVIVDENGIIKLIDFGSAGYVKLGPFDVFVGTIDYASPEVLRGERYGGKPQDIWAMGILLYTMIYKENPFYNVDEIMDGDLRFPFALSEGSENLIKKILVRDVSVRPTITDILEDAWLEDI